MTQEIKEAYRKIIERNWKGSRDMIDYCMSTAQEVVPVGSGFFVIKKPRIETSFCFGHGYCGRSTQEDEQWAYDMEHKAATDGSYFFNENMKTLKEKIKFFSKFEPYETILYKVHNNSEVSLCKTKSPIQTENGKWQAVNDKDCFNRRLEYDGILPENERIEVLEAYKRVAASFEKRLKTYLKKYGTSKLRTWTYLRD